MSRRIIGIIALYTGTNSVTHVLSMAEYVA